MIDIIIFTFQALKNIFFYGASNFIVVGLIAIFVIITIGSISYKRRR